VDGIGSGLCPLSNFVVSDEPIGSAIKVLSFLVFECVMH
jgi:hypothetical protein